MRRPPLQNVPITRTPGRRLFPRPVVNVDFAEIECRVMDNLERDVLGMLEIIPNGDSITPL